MAAVTAEIVTVSGQVIAAVTAEIVTVSDWWLQFTHVEFCMECMLTLLVIVTLLIEQFVVFCWLFLSTYCKLHTCTQSVNALFFLAPTSVWPASWIASKVV